MQSGQGKTCPLVLCLKERYWNFSCRTRICLFYPAVWKGYFFVCYDHAMLRRLKEEVCVCSRGENILLDRAPFELSPRLLSLTEWIPDRSRVADIGGDHANLLIYLAKSGCLAYGIVGELNQGPFENARRRIRDAGVQDFVEVRLGDGLSVLERNEVDVIVIAGMGGSLICQILSDNMEKLDGVKRLILQPNIGGQNVRRWLKEHGFCLAGELLVEDTGILYEALAAEPGEETVYEEIGELPEEILLEMGPLLWKNRHPLLKWKVEQIWSAKQRIYYGLQQAKSPTAIDKRVALEMELKEWGRVKQCLCTDLI